MAKKQAKDLRHRILANFPKTAKLKSYRMGGYNNQLTYVDIVSEAGNILASGKGSNLESALFGMIDKEAGK